MSLSKMTLTHFDVEGRTIVARYVLAVGGCDYNDNVVRGEKWLEFKPKSPFGQVPVVEVDGVFIAQTGAIARFLAEKLGLRGKDDLEKARADMILEAIDEVNARLGPVWLEKDAAKKKSLLDSFSTDWLPNFLNHLEKLKTGNGGDWMVGEGITYADLAITNVFGPVGALALLGVDWRHLAPKIAALVDRINEMPRVKEFVERKLSLSTPWVG